MTDEKLHNVLLLINDLYPGRAPAITERTVAVWMECFKEYDDSVVDQAVLTAVKECKYPPTINDLIGYCDQYKEIYGNMVADIRNIYREIVDLCERNELSSSTWDAFKECVKDEDIRVSQKKALEIGRRFSDLYRNRGYMETLPPLSEWLKQQKWE